jgi:hypothetical protein
MHMCTRAYASKHGLKVHHTVINWMLKIIKFELCITQEKAQNINFKMA